MSDSFIEYVRDQLHRMNAVEFRRMFGGYGLYSGATFFALISKDRLYFKTDATTQAAFKERGMQPFRPSTKQTLKHYYEVPADVLEDPELALQWAQRALTVARLGKPVQRKAATRGVKKAAR